MKNQPLQLLKLRDLIRFHRYVRRHRIHGKVRQNQFVTSARNTFMLALALPLVSATLEIEEREISREAVHCPAAK